MPSIPSIVTDTNITFFAAGTPWSLNSDHPQFGKVARLLEDPDATEMSLICVVDPVAGIASATDGRISLSGPFVLRDGHAIENWEWSVKLIDDPGLAIALLPAVSDTVEICGDEDCPDGTYTVAEVDDGDVEKRIYVETDDGFFGFVANTAIKGFAHA